MICSGSLSGLDEPGVSYGFHGSHLLHQPEEESGIKHGSGIRRSVNSGDE